MLQAQAIDGGHRITAVGWPASYWAELEARVGHPIPPSIRQMLQNAMDVEPDLPRFERHRLDELSFRGQRMAYLASWAPHDASFVRGVGAVG